MTTSMAAGSEVSSQVRYRVHVGAEAGGSVSLLIADRRNYLAKQHDTIEEAASADPDLLVDQIASQADQADYLLPDTPLKEAIFRVILAGRNEPMSAAEISAELGRRWTMSAYPRNLSASVVERLLGSMDSYSIESIAPPEPLPEASPQVPGSIKLAEPEEVAADADDDETDADEEGEPEDA